MSAWRWPLAVKLWSVFAGLTLLVFAMLALMLPWVLKSFFTDQLYDILVDSQESIHVAERKVVTFENAEAPRLAPAPIAGQPIPIEQGDQDMLELQFSNDNNEIRISPGAVLSTSGKAPVQHFIMEKRPDGSWTMPISDPVVSTIRENASLQVAPVEKYELTVNNENLFYVVRKELIDDQVNYIVSYAWGDYRNDLVNTMYGRLLLMMLALMLVSWLPCLLLARYMTRPLVQMERHVGRLAERDWHEPLVNTRKDEIGRLGQAIESMRQRLVKQDQAQQAYLQNVSHELKTPVMVIRSYAESIRDGIFPQGGMDNSLGIIIGEAQRMERRIGDILLLNKLQYLASREEVQRERIAIKPIVEDVIERLRYRRSDIKWELALDAGACLPGDPEEWKIAIENLLDNQLRYAKTVVRVEGMDGAPDGWVVRIGNDGPAIEPGYMEEMFEPFRKGANGQFGLGLAIVKQVAGRNGMDVRARNEENGVVFIIEPVGKGNGAGRGK